MTMRATEHAADFEQKGAVLMRNLGRIALAAMVATGTLVDSLSARASEAEESVAQHTMGEAPLAAHFVAIAGKAGRSFPDENKAILKDGSALDEFWVTKEKRQAYRTKEGFEFMLMPFRWPPFRTSG